MGNKIIQIVAVGLLLFGCESTAEKMAEKGVKPMTAAEITSTVSGNSLYQKGDSWEWTGYYKPDGTMTGRAWWNGGEETATGTWEVTDEGLMCRDWDNDWGGGGYGCGQWYKDGENVVYEMVSGSKGEYPTGTMTPRAGNAYDL